MITQATYQYQKYPQWARIWQQGRLSPQNLGFWEGRAQKEFAQLGTRIGAHSGLQMSGVFDIFTETYEKTKQLWNDGNACLQICKDLQALQIFIDSNKKSFFKDNGEPYILPYDAESELIWIQLIQTAATLETFKTVISPERFQQMEELVKKGRIRYRQVRTYGPIVVGTVGIFAVIGVYSTVKYLAGK